MFKLRDREDFIISQKFSFRFVKQLNEAREKAMSPETIKYIRLTKWTQICGKIALLTGVIFWIVKIYKINNP